MHIANGNNFKLGNQIPTKQTDHVMTEIIKVLKR